MRPGFLLTLLLVLAFFPTYRSGHDGARLAYQAAVLGILGFGLNNLATEVDLVNLSLGHFPSFSTAPEHWLLLGFVGVTLLLFGQAYCGYVCPFGALQEFLSRLGRRLYLRRYPVHAVEVRARYLKFVLLGLMLCAVWLSNEPAWSTFNPMQHLFGGHFPPWMILITALSLVGALVYYRFWCRYFCPFGAFLALGNKLALLKRLAPRRRFEHCDLGVRDEYDVDCLHCHRCLSARDFGVRAPPGGRHTRDD
jgi:polyferredoxin